MDTRPLMPHAEALSFMKEGALHWAAISPIWSTVGPDADGDAFLRRFERVTEPQGLLLAARWCVAEVCNGGFDQFYSNPTGVLAPEARRGFDFLGLHEAATIVDQANARLGTPYPRDSNERAAALKRIRGTGTKRSQWDPFYSMDASFYRVSGSQAFAANADTFVRAHMSMFFRETEWKAFAHPDGRTWAIRQLPDGFELRMTIGDPVPIVRQRRSSTPQADADALIADQLAAGFQPVS